MSPTGIWLLVKRNLGRHLLSSAVTAGVIALAGALTMAVFQIQKQALKAFLGGVGEYHAVLGARGSELQLVLNSIFHLETSPGNISWQLYDQVKNDARVKLAVPLAVGDNFLGFRVVGTTSEFFHDPKLTRISKGRFFEPELAEAVIGYSVARETGLAIGDSFKPYHGLSAQSLDEHQMPYKVVGLMAPSNTALDRIILIPIEGIFRMDGHVLRGNGESYVPAPGTEIPDEHKEISAVLLEFKSAMAGFQLAYTINRQGRVATLAFPIAKVINDLFKKIGWAYLVLEVVSFLVVLVASGAVLASLYNTMSERKVEFALLRVLGLGRRTLLLTLVWEATLIAFLGGVLAFPIFAVLMSIVREVVRSQTGLVLDVFRFHLSLVLVPSAMMALGALAGLVPGIKAYRPEVGNTLQTLV